MELSDVAHFQGAYCLLKDERLWKRVILGGSTTGGIRANNDSMSFITLFKNLKFDQQKFGKK